MQALWRRISNATRHDRLPGLWIYLEVEGKAMHTDSVPNVESKSRELACCVPDPWVAFSPSADHACLREPSDEPLFQRSYASADSPRPKIADQVAGDLARPVPRCQPPTAGLHQVRPRPLEPRGTWSGLDAALAQSNDRPVLHKCQQPTSLPTPHCGSLALLPLQACLVGNA